MTAITSIDGTFTLSATHIQSVLDGAVVKVEDTLLMIKNIPDANITSPNYTNTSANETYVDGTSSVVGSMHADGTGLLSATKHISKFTYTDASNNTNSMGGADVSFTITGTSLLGSNGISGGLSKLEIVDGNISMSLTGKLNLSATNGFQANINAGYYIQHLTIADASTGNIIDIFGKFGGDGNNGMKGTVSAVSYYDGSNYTFKDGLTYDIAGISTSDVSAVVAGGETITGYFDQVLSGTSGNDVMLGGVSDDILRSGAGNDTLNGGTGADNMSGGAGNDTYIVDDANDVVVEQTGEGTDLIQSSVSYSLGDAANVENLTLTGTEDIDATGNELANILTGNDGINVLDGGAGADILKGGKGNDTYAVDLKEVTLKSVVTAVFEDTVTELGSQGTDTIVLSGDISNTVASLIKLDVNVENLFAEGTNLTKLNFTGNASANEIHGNAADNIIDGGAGADILVGGAGNDTYIIDSKNDIFIEGAGDSSDTVVYGVNASATLLSTLTLGSANAAVHLTATTTTSLDLTNIENLTITGTGKYNIDGDAVDNILKGNAGVNTIRGDLGNDTLDGGAGLDILNGGAGNDTYIVDSIAEVALIVEDVTSADVDTVQSSITMNIAANLGVENLTLAGVAAINGTGNDLDNTLTGNAAANTLDGGIGADTLVGGLGNDTYIVDDANDVVVEQTGEGTDLIQSSVSYSLGDAANVENLTLTGTEDIDATGNELANILTGNDGINVLDGGAGADILKGGKGNDTYAVDLKEVTLKSVVTAVFEDTVTELGSQGTDTIVLSGDISNTVASLIKLDVNVENLFAEGTNLTKLNFTGNASANEIHGNAADNIISGGAGNDVLVGGGGNDTFVFNTALSASTNVDQIVDFASGDHIQLSAAIFTKLSGDTNLSDNIFTLGSGVQDTNDYLVYNSTTGALYYDANALLAGAGVQVATLTGTPTLTGADFIMGA